MSYFAVDKGLALDVIRELARTHKTYDADEEEFCFQHKLAVIEMFLDAEVGEPLCQLYETIISDSFLHAQDDTHWGDDAGYVRCSDVLISNLEITDDDKIVEMLCCANHRTQAILQASCLRMTRRCSHGLTMTVLVATQVCFCWILHVMCM
jgi:hypothetical protein